MRLPPRSSNGSSATLRSIDGATTLALASSLLASACTFDFEAPFAGAGGGDDAVSSSSSGSGNPTSGPGGGSGGSTTGSTTSTESGGGQGGGGAGQPQDEVCDNGRDDDDDGDVDCADDDCDALGFTCAPAAPEGFLGPVALIRGEPLAPPSCGGTFPREAVAGGIGELTAEAATCSDCSCGGVAGVTCSASIEFFDDPTCLVPSGDENEVGPPGCVDVGNVVAGFARASVPEVAGGSCRATGGVADVPDAFFEESAKLCSASLGAGCSAEVCLRAPDPPFEAQLCVYRMGVETCDRAAPFTEPLEIRSVDDERGCTSCSCAAPEGVICSGSTTVYGNNDGCNGQNEVLPHDGNCRPIDDSRSQMTSLTPSGGTCDASGGVPTGTAFATDPVTVCCLP